MCHASRPCCRSAVEMSGIITQSSFPDHNAQAQNLVSASQTLVSIPPG